MAQDSAKAIALSADATIIYQSAINPNAIDNTREKPNDVTYSVDIFLQKEIAAIHGKTLMHLEGGQGKGVDNKLLLFNKVNRDADEDNDVHISEAWYQQNFFKEKLSLTVGKLDATVNWDNNAFTNDETKQFLRTIFRNNPTIEFPDNTPGLTIQTQVPAWLEISVGLLSSDGELEKIDQDVFEIVQADFKTKFSDLEGNYRVIGWRNTSPHAKWTAPDSSANAYGFSVCLDQALPMGIGAFARYGWENPNAYSLDAQAEDSVNFFSLEQSWSIGLNIQGKPWGRENDLLALAVGSIVPSSDYKKATNKTAESEGHLEAYYNARFNDHFAISPDYQLIWNPYGNDVANGKESISVIGVRVQITF
jgi:hypothetical protein